MLKEWWQVTALVTVIVTVFCFIVWLLRATIAAPVSCQESATQFTNVAGAGEVKCPTRTRLDVVDVQTKADEHMTVILCVCGDRKR